MFYFVALFKVFFFLLLFFFLITDSRVKKMQQK
jgi:hypothetical protein